MDFDLSDDQRALQAAARDLLDGAASPERVRGAIGDGGTGTEPPFDTDLWKQMAAQGWLTLELPEADGGLGLGFVEVAVLAEEVGRHVAPAPFVSTSLGLAAFAGAAAEEANGWMGRLASGEAVGCAGFADEPVVDAPIADVAVLVRDGDVRAVDLGGAPLSVEPAMDLTRSVAWLGAEAIADRETTVLGGADLAEAMLDRGAAVYSAELLGAAERMLEVSVEYAKVREQFGRPIGSFQAIKHRLADAMVDVEGMRSAAYYAAWAVGAGAPDRSLAASSAKAWCSEAARRVLESALQVHGGIGFTWEHDLHLYLKRGHLDATVFGDASHHYARVARLLRDRVEAGVDLW